MSGFESEMPAAPDFHLESGERLRDEAPETFHIPSRDARENLRIGDIVKLVFALTDRESADVGAERMWVIVKEEANGRYIGALDNDPFCLVGIKAGDLVEFGPEHVIDIHDGDDSP